MNQNNHFKDEEVIRSLFDITKIAGEDLKEIGDSSWSLFGGSGFVGRWIAAALLFAARNLSIPLEVRIITRNIDATEKRLRAFFPQDLQSPKVITFDEFLQTTKSELPHNKTSYNVFGATPTTNFPNDLGNVTSYFKTVIDKISNVKYPPIVLNLSSGAVYKKAFSQNELIFEGDERQKLNQSINIYQECKIAIEDILFEKACNGLIKAVNPRLFTFAGPGFPLEAHFAVSNFVKSCMESGEIHVMGHPRTSRSYMDPVDMVSWLIRLVRLEEKIGLKPIHIGSNESVSMSDLAGAVMKIFGGSKINYVEDSIAIPNRYIPSTSKTMELLGTSYTCDLESTLLKWKNFLITNNQVNSTRWD